MSLDFISSVTTVFRVGELLDRANQHLAALFAQTCVADREADSLVTEPLSCIITVGDDAWVELSTVPDYEGSWSMDDPPEDYGHWVFFGARRDSASSLVSLLLAISAAEVGDGVLIDDANMLRSGRVPSIEGVLSRLRTVAGEHSSLEAAGEALAWSDAP